MLKKCTILTTTLTLLVGVALLAPSADPASPAYQAVANWPQLPAGAKLGGVTAVATDAADRVYVFHRGKQPIMVFEPGGKFLRAWGDGLVKTAHGLRLDPQGNVWITDIGNQLVTKFDPAGKVLLTLGTRDKPGDTPTQFNKPADVAFAANGDVYVADGYGNSRVVKFSREGKYLMEWGKRGTGAGEFHLPHAICVDGQERVYVGDRENNRVQVFDAAGKFLAQWPESGAPFGLFLTGHEQMLVADGRGNRVKVLNMQGKPLSQWGVKGSEPGQFVLPHGICMDSQGAIYVAEVSGLRVQKFAAK